MSINDDENVVDKQSIDLLCCFLMQWQVTVHLHRQCGSLPDPDLRVSMLNNDDENVIDK